MTNQFFLWFTGTFLSSRSHYHRHNWSVICRVLLCLFTKISRHHWGLLLSPKLWMVSSTFFVLLLCLTVYLLLHFGQWKNWNTTCKSLSKRSFLFFIPRKFTFKTQLDVSRIFQTHFQACLFMGLHIALFLLDSVLASSTVGSLVGFMLSSHCPKEHFCFLWLLLFWFFNTV